MPRRPANLTAAARAATAKSLIIAICAAYSCHPPEDWCRDNKPGLYNNQEILGGRHASNWIQKGVANVPAQRECEARIGPVCACARCADCILAANRVVYTCECDRGRPQVGDDVKFRDAQATVVHVDNSMEPPGYTVRLADGSEVSTELSRLTPIGDAREACPHRTVCERNQSEMPTPIECFNMYYTEDMWELQCAEMEAYPRHLAAQRSENRPSYVSSVLPWPPKWALNYKRKFDIPAIKRMTA